MKLGAVKLLSSLEKERRSSGDLVVLKKESGKSKSEKVTM
jgi:hypothetical protein